MTEFPVFAPFAAWISPLDEVPDDAFAQGMLGEGLALDPLEAVVRSPIDGQVMAIAPTRHSVTIRHASGAELLLHVGIDTVHLGGRGFTCRTAVGKEVKAGETLLELDLELIADGAKCLISPLVVLGDKLQFQQLTLNRAVAAGEQIGVIHLDRNAAPQPNIAGSEPLHLRTFVFEHPDGLHARPSARVASLLQDYTAEVQVVSGSRRANARSITSLMKLDLRAGDAVTLEAKGSDAEHAISAVAEIMLSGPGTQKQAIPLSGDTPSSLPTEPGTIKGIRAASGGAIGSAVPLSGQDPLLPTNCGTVDEEVARLSHAVASLEARLHAHSTSREIAQAHRSIVTDPDLHDAARSRMASGESAAAAWRAATRSEVAALEVTGNSRLMERAADLVDVERQLLGLLVGEAESGPDLPENAILLADELLPSAFYRFDMSRIAGIVTARGGATSHAAILAGAKGIPMLVGCGRDVLAIAQGTPILIESERPVARIAPAATDISAFEKAAQLSAERARLQREAASANCQTADGKRIEVFANCGSAEDAAQAALHGAEGCGLLRSEFLFLGRSSAPSVEEQAAVYASIATALPDRPLIVRTLDAGSDKPLPYMPLAAEENPALGLRGIRLTLTKPHLLEDQFTAILRGVPEVQRRIMLPMVTDLSEFNAARQILRKAEQRVGVSNPTPLGVMIETPAAAIMAGALASEADFLSVGSNDLAQYALAADRQNPDLAGGADALHPAVLHLIWLAAEGAHKHGRWIGLCGALASEPRAAALLIGLGIDELSATPATIPAVKTAVRAFTFADARSLAIKALEQTTAAAVHKLIEEYWHATRI